MERLGGIDFDEAIFRHVLDSIREAGLEPDSNDPGMLPALAHLREECRRAKEALSSDTDTTIAVYLPAACTDVRLTRAEFEAMIRPRITETIGALGRAVRSAGLDIGSLDRILLVGGSSRIPLVGEMVREATGRPVALDAHPKHTMALGAAYSARQGLLRATPQDVPGATANAPVEVASTPSPATTARTRLPMPRRLGAASAGRRMPILAAFGMIVLALVAAGLGLQALSGGVDRTPGPQETESAGPGPQETVLVGPGPQETALVDPGPRPVVVPMLVGLREGEVPATLEAAGLVPGLRRGAFHPTAPAGEVIDQSPAAGAESLPGRSVGYTVSAGPRPVVVPMLVGLREGEVPATLEAAGLAPGLRRGAFHPTAPAGEVIDQSPAAGAESLPGRSVGYTVSAGPRPVVVPMLVGLREGEVPATLEAAGWRRACGAGPSTPRPPRARSSTSPRPPARSRCPAGRSATRSRQARGRWWCPRVRCRSPPGRAYRHDRGAATIATMTETDLGDPDPAARPRCDPARGGIGPRA